MKIRNRSINFQTQIQDLRFKKRNIKSEIEKINRPRLKIGAIACFGLILLTLPGAACVNKSLLANKNNSAATPEIPLSDYERDLQTMKTANFDYIFVFRRRDGNAFDGDDKKYVKTNSPGGTNRFVLTDSDRAVIAGSRYAFSPENLAALRNRFAVEDFSKAQEAAPPTNVKQ